MGGGNPYLEFFFEIFEMTVLFYLVHTNYI